VDTGYVFTTEIGTPIEPDNLRRTWYPLRRLPGMTVAQQVSVGSWRSLLWSLRSS
jgi:hypothetical protein